MKLQFAVNLTDRHGHDITETDPKEKGREKPVSLGQLCCAVLDAPFESDRNEGIKEKMRKWDLMKKITDAEKELSPLDLPIEDITFLKERICKAPYPTTLAGAAMVALETAVPDAATGARQQIGGIGNVGKIFSDDSSA